MNWNVSKKISLGYVIVLLILVFFGFLSYTITRNLVHEIALVEKTQNEMILLFGVVSQLNGAESSGRGYIITGDAEYLQFYNESLVEIPKDLKQLESYVAENEILTQMLNDLKVSVNVKLDSILRIVNTKRSGALESAEILLKIGTGKEEMDTIMANVTQIETKLDALLKERTAIVEKSTDQFVRMIIFGIPAVILLVVFIGIRIIRDITIPLKEATTIAESIAAGDLTLVNKSVGRKDELGVLFKAFEKMIIALREINHEIIEGVNVITSASSDVMASSAQVASGAMETSSAISQTTSAVEEVKQSAQNVNDKARSVSNATQLTVKVSEKGLHAISQSIEGMNRIQGQVGSISQSLIQLSEQSQTISEIITSVNDIAEQSNLLSVNAAIEAARAGEQGRGFSVVAQEVKVLAEQSKEATGRVRAILNEVLKAIHTAVVATDLGGKFVEAGVDQSKEASNQIRMMAEGIGNAAEMAMQITIASQQQLVGMDQIALAMESIRQASEQNVSGTRQVESTMQNLHLLGQRLANTTQRYRL